MKHTARTLLVAGLGALTLTASLVPAQAADSEPRTVGRAHIPPELQKAILAAPADTPVSGKAADIPPGVLSLLGREADEFADAGGFYNVSDVTFAGRPRVFQRVVWAARIGDYYLLNREHGGLGSGAGVEAFLIEPSGRPRFLWYASVINTGLRGEPQEINRYRTFASFQAALAADEIGFTGPGSKICGTMDFSLKPLQLLFPADGAPAAQPVSTVPDSVMPILRGITAGERPAGTDISQAPTPRVSWSAKLGDFYIVQYAVDRPGKAWITIAKDPPSDLKRGYWTAQVKAYPSFEAMRDEVRRSMRPDMEYRLRHGICSNKS